MNFAEIIEKKKHREELSTDEIKWLISNYITGDVPDYQMASFAMAVWFNQMTSQETSDLTQAMIDSGITYDLSQVSGRKADKHSTGGVGDKTSLIFSPLVASFGVKVAKLSGRGLGQTGGTIDKLESCPGWTGEISNEEFIHNLNTVGISIMAQSSAVVPADKKLYALRDVTGTVDSIPLISASIMSKKLVVPADSIILDVKMGSGAFMKDLDSAIELSNTMIEIGKHHHRNIGAMITNMDRPLGRAIGNAIEVKEAWDTLHGRGPDDLVELCTTAAAITLMQNGIFKTIEEGKTELVKKLNDGSTAHFLKDFIEAQHGDFSVIENYDQHFTTKHAIQIFAKQDGFLKFNSTDELGLLSMRLGAGRARKEDSIDFAAGIYLHKSSDEAVKNGDLVMTLFTNRDDVANFEKDAYALFDINAQQTNEPTILKVMYNVSEVNN
jgi:pyrimidine-nucleoside phosphorylase